MADTSGQSTSFSSQCKPLITIGEREGERAGGINKGRGRWAGAWAVGGAGDVPIATTQPSPFSSTWGAGFRAPPCVDEQKGKKTSTTAVLGLVRLLVLHATG